MHRAPVLLLLLAVAAAVPLAAQPAARLAAAPSAQAVLAVRPSTEALVYATRSHLIFQSVDGHVEVPIDGTLVGTATSAEGGYVTVATRADGDGARTMLSLRTYAARGALRFEHTLPHDYDAPFPMLAVDEATGATAFIQPATAEVVFLGGDGAERARSRPFGDAPYSLERSVRLVFAPDGRNVYVAAMRRPVHPDAADDDNVHLFAFDASGVLQWRRPVSGEALQEVAVSEDGSRIAVSTYDLLTSGEVERRTHILDRAGMPRMDVPFGFEHADFSEHDLLLVTRRGAAVVDLASGDVRLRYATPAHDVQLLDGVLDPLAGRATLLTGRATLTDAGFVYAHPRLVHLDETGVVADETDVGTDTARLPALQSTAEGFRLVLDHSVLTYAWSSLR